MKGRFEGLLEQRQLLVHWETQHACLIGIDVGNAYAAAAGDASFTASLCTVRTEIGRVVWW
jgi:hypothetical protein